MADAFVQLPDDSGNTGGKKVRTQTRTVGGNEVHEHMFNLVDPLPAGTNNIGDVDVLSLPAITGTVTANAGTNLNTSLLALESGGNLATIAGIVTSARAAVNPISGQIGVQGNTGVVTATTQRVVLATDVGLPAGSAVIGHVIVDSGAINATLSAETTKVIGTVNQGTSPWVISGAVTMASQVPVGTVAHDAPAAAVNPLLIGGYASAAAPTDVSADNDSVRAWFLRNGAQAMVLTAAGALIGGDAANGLDIDVTRMSALVAGSAIIGKVGIDQTTPGTTNLVALSAETTKVIGVVRTADGSGNLLTSTSNALDVNLKTSSITLPVSMATQTPSGSVAHDGVGTGVNPLLIGGYASAAAPADVSADGDATRAWVLRNGARATVLTAAGALIGGDAANGLDVDVTRLSALVAGSAIIGKVGIDQTTPGTTNLVALTAETTKVIGTIRLLGNVGAVLDGVNTAATAPANGILGLGIFNSTEPSPTTGQSVGIQLDSKGRQRMVIMDAAGNTRGANVDSSNRMSTTDNIATWNGVAPAAAAALADGASVTPTVPTVGSVILGVRSTDSSATNLDRAFLSTLFDLDTGSNVQRVLGVQLRTGASGGSVEAGVAANPLSMDLANTVSNSTSQPVLVAGTLLDNAGFTDGTTKVLPIGYIFDESAGTALTENDIGASRMDSKRALVHVLEDETTRGTRQTVTSGKAALVTPFFNARSDTFTTTSNGTTVDATANPVKYFSLQTIATGAVTSWTIVLEGSLDGGTTFFTILTASNATPAPTAVAAWPVTKLRTRCTAIVLGGGTNVIAYQVATS